MPSTPRPIPENEFPKIHRPENVATTVICEENTLTNSGVNKAVVLVDASGSIRDYRLQDKAVEFVDQTVTKLRAEGFDVKIVKFSNAMQEIATINRNYCFPDYTQSGPSTSGSGTALFDALRDTIVNSQLGFADTFTLICITDGWENSSTHTTAKQLQDVFKRAMAMGRYTIAVNVPTQFRDRFLMQSGLDSENVNPWEVSEEGFSRAEQQTSSGIAAHSSNLKSGRTSTPKFFTDASKLKAKTLEKKLANVAPLFRKIAVTGDSVIRNFVETKTKKPYVTGSTYYLLTKPEKVQAYKAIIIQEKGKKEAYTGEEARTLLGIPVGADAKVVPGNHGNYDIFIQSCSNNRKLVRGSHIMVEKKPADQSRYMINHLAPVSA